MKYQKKPEIVEAYQFHTGPGPHTWPEGWLSTRHSIVGDGHCRIQSASHMIMDAEDGDWITKSEDDDFHVVSDYVFRQIYEPVK